MVTLDEGDGVTLNEGDGVTLYEGDGVTLDEGDWLMRAASTRMPLILLLNLFLPLMFETLVLGKHLCWVFLAIFWEISVMLVEE